jgi:hypothetical protein
MASPSYPLVLALHVEEVGMGLVELVLELLLHSLALK